MKTSLSFFTICFLIINNIASANDLDLNKNSKTKIGQPHKEKPTFKISERRILKKSKVEREEEQVSSFSMEELRLGAQKPLSKSEIQYFKSLCRYAFMSDRDVIENRCEVKEVSHSKK